MSEALIIAYIAAGAVVLAPLIKFMGDFSIRKYRRNRELLRIYKGMEEGFVELYRRRMPRRKGKWPTELAAKRHLRDTLRKMGYDTPGKKGNKNGKNKIQDSDSTQCGS